MKNMAVLKVIYKKHRNTKYYLAIISTLASCTNLNNLFVFILQEMLIVSTL